MKNLTGAEYAATKYIELTVNENIQLLDFVIKAMHGISKNKAKDILSGRGITVNGKIETQYNYQLTPGCKVKISNSQEILLVQYFPKGFVVVLPIAYELGI